MPGTSLHETADEGKTRTKAGEDRRRGPGRVGVHHQQVGALAGHPDVPAGAATDEWPEHLRGSASASQ
jgi:hypothetical protein